MKYLKALYIVGLYLSALDLFVFYSFCIRAINKLGFVPYYNHPDPSKLGFNFHYALVWQVSNILIVPIGLLILAIIFYLIKKQSILAISKVHFIMSLALLFLEIFTYISSLNSWFLD
jgi:hypothetical protein